jgi:hypothetical protein
MTTQEGFERRTFGSQKGWGNLKDLNGYLTRHLDRLALHGFQGCTNFINALLFRLTRQGTNADPESAVIWNNIDGGSAPNHSDVHDSVGTLQVFGELPIGLPRHREPIERFERFAGQENGIGTQTRAGAVCRTSRAADFDGGMPRVHPADLKICRLANPRHFGERIEFVLPCIGQYP